MNKLVIMINGIIIIIGKMNCLGLLKFIIIG